jgi:hypothetical protein
VVGGAEHTFSAEPVTWRGQVAVPAVDLCRMLGLGVQFDKASLTARVGRRLD